MFKIKSTNIAKPVKKAEADSEDISLDLPSFTASASSAQASSSAQGMSIRVSQTHQQVDGM